MLKDQQDVCERVGLNNTINKLEFLINLDPNSSSNVSDNKVVLTVLYILAMKFVS